MNIISFALFGPDPKYRTGMLANVRMASTFYPGWKVLIYCDRINHEALSAEELSTDTECILQQDQSQGVEGMSWRMQAVLRPQAEAVIFRDADSIFTRRETEAVREWLSSNKDTHIIRDHPYHVSPIMGGLLGVRGKARELLAELVRQRMQSHRLTEYGDDQVFLSKDFYPKVLKTAMVHTNCVRIWPEFTRPLLPDQAGDHFIGAYAFLTDAEHEEYERIRKREQPKTLLPDNWKQHRLTRRIYAKLGGRVQRIRYGCRWCL